MKKIAVLFTVIILSVKGFSQNIIMPVTGSQTITTCCNKFYDSGDSLLNYSNNENGQITFLPSPPYVISITFTFFSVSDTGDVLRIYNGNSTAAPLLGTYSVAGMPVCNTITSTDTVTGGLTISFQSNGAGTSGGWRARVSCVTDTVYAYPHGINCAAPYWLFFQYSATCQTTECFVDDYTSSTPGVCSPNFSSGEDKVYYFQTSGSGNMQVLVSNLNTPNCGLFLYYYNCPPATGNCIRMDTTVVNGELCVSLPVTAGMQFYIVVDTWAPPMYVDFDINVDPFLGICLPTGVDYNEQTLGDVFLIPNPAVGELVVGGSEFGDKTEIEIYNMLGEKRLTLSRVLGTTKERDLRVDVSSLPAGVYFVSVRDDKGNKITRRFVKM